MGWVGLGWGGEGNGVKGDHTIHILIAIPGFLPLGDPSKEQFTVLPPGALGPRIPRILLLVLARRPQLQLGGAEDMRELPARPGDQGAGGGLDDLEGAHLGVQGGVHGGEEAAAEPRAFARGRDEGRRPHEGVDGGVLEGGFVDVDHGGEIAGCAGGDGEGWGCHVGGG